MITRLGMIEEIRDAIEAIIGDGRFDYLKWNMGDLDRFNFAGVPDETIRDLYVALCMSYTPQGV